MIETLYKEAFDIIFTYHGMERMQKWEEKVKELGRIVDKLPPKQQKEMEQKLQFDVGMKIYVAKINR